MSFYLREWEAIFYICIFLMNQTVQLVSLTITFVTHPN